MSFSATCQGFDGSLNRHFRSRKMVDAGCYHSARVNGIAGFCFLIFTLDLYIWRVGATRGNRHRGHPYQLFHQTVILSARNFASLA